MPPWSASLGTTALPVGPRRVRPHGWSREITRPNSVSHTLFDWRSTVPIRFAPVLQALDTPTSVPFYRQVVGYGSDSSRPLLPCAWLVALSACGGAGAGAGPIRTETDSAGVRIVEFAGEGFATAPFRITERLRIGLLDGPEEYIFSTIAGGVLRAGGSFAVADRGSSQVRTFSRTGTLLARQGRQGQGPGEYEYIRAVGRCHPAGFTVFDLHWRVNQYDSTGTFLETWQPMLEGGATPYQLACSRSGRFAAINWDLSGPRAIGVYTTTARLRTLRPDGTEESDLGPRLGSERVGTRGGSRPHPFGRSTHLAFDGEDLIVTDGSFFGYERWSPDGRLTGIVRVRLPAPNLDSLVSGHVEHTMSRIRRDGRGNVAARISSVREDGEVLRSLGKAAWLSDMRVLHSNVLLREQAATPDLARWFVFDEDGTPLGFLRLPPGARLLDLDGAHILTAEADSSDVPQVVLYEYRREE